jgi:hypothetical protein
VDPNLYIIAIDEVEYLSIYSISILPPYSVSHRLYTTTNLKSAYITPKYQRAKKFADYINERPGYGVMAVVKKLVSAPL